MINVPFYSDLGTDLSHEQKSSWEAMLAEREMYFHYFSGQVFEDTLPQEVGAPDTQVKRFPVGVNLVKMLCTAQADAAFGEWDEKIIQFGNRLSGIETSGIKDAVQVLDDIVYFSNGNSMFLELEMQRNIYGGGAIKVCPRMDVNDPVHWTLIPWNSFFPVWDPTDPDKLLEVYIVTGITPEQARAMYAVDTTAAVVLCVEHWTTGIYEFTVDGRKLDPYSGVNIWGIVPFVYFPRFRTHNWYGDALTADVMKTQDEVNLTLADMGDALAYNGNPIRYAYNLPRSFSSKNFPVSPGSMWDLGRTLGSMPEPHVGVLEVDTPIPEASFKYLTFVYSWSRNSTFSPPIAFGEDENAGSTGATLEIRMWPLIKSVRRSRAYHSTGMDRLIRMTGHILRQKRYPGIAERAYMAMLNGDVSAKYETILPRDHHSIVDEVVKLSSTTPPEISPETAQKILGRDVGEVDRIRTALKDKTLYPEKEPTSNDLKEGVKGKLTPQETK